MTLPIAPPRISASAQPNRRWPPCRAQHPDDEDRGGDAQADEEPALPARGAGEERERRAGVVGADDVEERRRRGATSLSWKVADDQRLGDLVEQTITRQRRCRARATSEPACRRPSGDPRAASPAPNRLLVQRPQIVGCAGSLPTSRALVPAALALGRRRSTSASTKNSLASAVSPADSSVRRRGDEHEAAGRRRARPASAQSLRRRP